MNQNNSSQIGLKYCPRCRYKEDTYTRDERQTQKPTKYSQRKFNGNVKCFALQNINVHEQ